MKIWIDAAAAPRDVKEITARAAKRLELQTLVVANPRLWVPPGNPFLEAVRVGGGPDVADAWIVEHAEPGDLAITADIPLAALLVEKGVHVLDHRGEETPRATSASASPSETSWTTSAPPGWRRVGPPHTAPGTSRRSPERWIGR